eukprot:GDKI01005326.1.p1 GENE.GDKI01005326.1~~GDKI01005326.1.p1  ORF type:complete len:327 (-),score=84.92 GDKI01005326.1:268-1248(-)
MQRAATKLPLPALGSRSTLSRTTGLRLQLAQIARNLHTSSTRSARQSSQASGSTATPFLDNHTPPGYPVSVHKGYKVQASLVLDRLPLQYKEAEYEKEFRLFKEQWMQRTATDVQTNDELIFMGYADQFIETEEEKKKKQRLLQTTGDAAVSELEHLLAQEGLDMSTMQRRERRKKRGKEKQEAEIEMTDAGLQNINRLRDETLYLLVKYQEHDSWMFPLVDRVHGHSMRDTLSRLVAEQLNPMEPYLVGTCPFAFDKRKFANDTIGIEGRKVFYYRGHWVPGSSNLELSKQSPVADFAWCSAKELPTMLSERKLHAVRPAIFLDL